MLTDSKVASLIDQPEGNKPVRIPIFREDGRERRRDNDEPISLFRVAMNPMAKNRVAKVLESGYIGDGDEVKSFEYEFAELVGAERSVVMVNSCTSALMLALHLAGVKPGRKVITTPMTCFATTSAILSLGAEPVWADVDPNTGLINPRSVQKLLPDPGVSAIVAVDWAGVPCDYAALKDFGLPVVQDAAHRIFALGGEHGDYVAWSHQAIKHLTTGDGGTLLTPPDQYERAKLLKWYGLDRESGKSFRCAQDITECGQKWQSNNIAAAIGRANIHDTAHLVAKHRLHAKMLGGAVEEADYWFYPYLTDRRDEFIQFCASMGIEASPVHRRNDEYSCVREYRAELPGLDKFSSRNVGLPSHSFLGEKCIGRIRNIMSEWECRQRAAGVSTASH